MTHQQFADAVGVSRGAVQQWESGATAPKRPNQPAVAKFMGISISELMSDADDEVPPHGSGFSSLDAEINAIQQFDEPINRQLEIERATLRWKSIEAKKNDKYNHLAPAERANLATNNAANALQVPLLENSGSMGEGSAMLDGDVLAGQLTLNPIWVSSTLHPSRHDALRFIHGYGDSMTPTFNSGDVLLVDTGINEVKIDGVYVLTAHDRLFIKRVRQRMDGVFEISSDNPTHKTVDVLNGNHDVLVLGRVIWVWNGRRT